MGVANALLFLLLACLVSLTPLAQASPPDPTWIPGIYDNADYDDVVSLVTNSEGAVKLVDATQALPLLPAAGRVPAVESDLAPRSPGLSAQPRAPPAS
ncbi:MAG TPA: hypothetical protein VJX92_29450 [Methylomirabilota bacterium]|nr:hypothetical protein [Methylomirabilota bacterium]